MKIMTTRRRFLVFSLGAALAALLPAATRPALAQGAAIGSIRIAFSRNVTDAWGDHVNLVAAELQRTLADILGGAFHPGAGNRLVVTVNSLWLASYAGGGGSVRGFRYQSLGKQFASGRPVGGTAVDVGSVEFRQRIGASWGAVGFVDAGQISSDGVPFTGSPHVGAGVGVRYYTGIGPVRLDVAVPLTRERKGDAFELYIGLGQAF